MRLPARGAGFGEVMSGLEAEGSGTMLTCVLPQRINPFLSLLSQSQSGFCVFLFNLKHPVTLSPTYRFRCGKTYRIREVSGFGVFLGEKRQRRKGH